MIRRGSKTFSRAAAVLPLHHRRGAFMLYTWARHCDDVIDRQSHGHRVPGHRPASAPNPEELERLREATRRALEGEPSQPEFAAIRRVVHDYRVPPSDPFVFLEGMEMDVLGRRYETLDELAVYCFHVAGALAQMAARVVDVHDPPMLAQVGELGIAFQLTNIARDVMDDAESGRVYLPLALLEAESVPPEAVRDMKHRAAVARVVARVLDEAEVRYRRAGAAWTSAPFRSAWAIRSAHGMYADLARLVRRRGVRALDERTVVSPLSKLAWLGRGLARATIDRLP